MKRLTPVLAACCLILGSCNSGMNEADKEEAVGNETPGQPVETREQDAGFEPAFAGQFRAPAVKTSTAYEVQVITDQLNSPWGITPLPDNRFLITEKEGTMRIVSLDGQVSEKITGIPEVMSDGQGGLLDVKLDPDFASNRMVYWTFSEPTDKGNLTAVAKGVLSKDDRRIENATVIFRATPAFDGDKHFGSRLIFDSSGNLFVTTADRYDEERRKYAQDLSTALGKVLRITKDGKPASGNPFAGQSGANAAVYSYGHRNVQGIGIHPETGDVWISEMGPQGGDELNLIEAGKNYGWPVITYGIEYNDDKIGEAITQREGMEQPVYFWDPVLSPSGMTFYKGDAIPEWKNNLFIGGLNSHHIARLVLENKRVVGEERLLADQQQRFRSVTEGNDGALYAITDEGRLYRIGVSK